MVNIIVKYLGKSLMMIKRSRLTISIRVKRWNQIENRLSTIMKKRYINKDYESTSMYEGRVN